MTRKILFISTVSIAIVIAGFTLLMNSRNNYSAEVEMGTSTTADSLVATTSVIIKGYMFEPARTRVKVGDTVTWTNQDSVEHNIIAVNPSNEAPNGPLIGKGETYGFTFNKAGTYKYYCGPHPSMRGTIEVTL